MYNISFEGIRANLIYIVWPFHCTFGSSSTVYYFLALSVVTITPASIFLRYSVTCLVVSISEPLISCMDLQNLIYIVLAVSVVGCACQVILCFTVIYLLVHLKRIQKKVQRLSLKESNSCNLSSNDSLRLRELSILPLRAQCAPGESITVLHRNPHPSLPAQFGTTEGSLRRNDTGESANRKSGNLEANNEGFDHA